MGITMSNIDQLLITVFNHPLTYIIVGGVLIYLIIKQLNEGKLRPEQKPDFGVKVRAERVKKHLDKRDKAFAVKPKKAYLFRDVFKIGKIVSIEDIPIKGNPKELMIYSIAYRRLGFFNWLISSLGFGRQRIFVDDQHIKGAFNDKTKSIDYVINKNIRFKERGGVLILSSRDESKVIDEINSDQDYENLKGFVSDFPRRASNIHPAHAMKTDTLELESDLEERGEAKKRFSWGKGN